MMKVLVATSFRQGDRADDRCDTVEGELVVVPGPGCGDATCECQRAFVGLASRGVTTTALVKRRTLDFPAYEAVLADALAGIGWPAGTDPDPAVIELVVRETTLIAQVFPVGAVVERHGRQVRAR